MGFDIDGLLDFEPASGRCVKCLALLPSVKASANTHKCPVCGLTAFRNNIFTATTGNIVGSLATSTTPMLNDGSSMYAYGYGYQLLPRSDLPGFLLPVAFNKDAMDHAKELAGFARLLR